MKSTIWVVERNKGKGWYPLWYPLAFLAHEKREHARRAAAEWADQQFEESEVVIKYRVRPYDRRERGSK